LVGKILFRNPKNVPSSDCLQMFEEPAQVVDRRDLFEHHAENFRVTEQELQLSAEQITTRHATDSDVPVISRFITELLEELSGGLVHDRNKIELDTQKVLAMDSVTAILSFVGPAPCGVVLLNECAAIYAGGVFGEITELFIAPSHRSKGIAPKLLKAADDVALSRGWSRLEVGAPDQPAWRRSLEFYLKEGFEEVGPRLRKVL